MISKTDDEMKEEIMAGGQFDQMKALLNTLHGGRTESGQAATALLELAQSLHEQAMLKGYHAFDIFDTLILANEQVCLEAACAGGHTSGAMKL